MKVVLIKDVKDLGQKGDIVDVADGYALNRLMPQGFAVSAASTQAAEVLTARARQVEQKEEHTEDRKKAIKDLDGKTLHLSRKANEQGGLYDKVDAAELVAAVNTEFGTALEVSHLEGALPLENLGEYTMAVVDGDIKSELTVVVGAEAA